MQDKAAAVPHPMAHYLLPFQFPIEKYRPLPAEGFVTDSACYYLGGLRYLCFPFLFSEQRKDE